MSKPIKPSKDKSIEKMIDAALITHVFKQAYLGQATSAFCATIIFISLVYTYPDISMLYYWYGAFMLIMGLRLVAAKIFFMQKTVNISLTNLWKKVLIIGAILGGICWGFAGSFLFSHVNVDQQMLIILILAGVTAGASPLLAAELVSSIMFSITSLTPLIVYLFILNDRSVYNLFAFTAVAYCIYLVVISFKLHRTIKDSIALRFENNALLENISNAKIQLELSNKKLMRVANHDPLTQVANRNLFESSLIAAIKKAKKNNRIMALLYIDLDNFKEVNDAYGHHIGDQLLLRVVQRLQKNIRESDVIARLGGDEITIIIENISDPEVVFTITKLICSEISKPFIIQDYTIVVTASIGVSVYPVDGEDPETLLKNADAFMYSVKEHGRNSFKFSEEINNKRILLSQIFKSSTNQRSTT